MIWADTAFNSNKTESNIIKYQNFQEIWISIYDLVLKDSTVFFWNRVNLTVTRDRKIALTFFLMLQIENHKESRYFGKFVVRGQT